MNKLLVSLALAAAAAFAQEIPVRILVAFHSDTGNTEAFARAVRDGAAAMEGIEVAVRKVRDVSDGDIAKADGILLGTPVHWEGLSTEAKRFLDRVGDILFKAGKTAGEGRTAGAFCTGGALSSGKELARISILAAFLAMRFIVIGGVDAQGYGTLGAQATTGPDDPGLSEKELAEARAFGERFARLTWQVRRR